MSDGAADLLAWLREQTGEPGLDYAEPPAHLGEGVFASVQSFRLRGAPPALSGPLVQRHMAPAPAWSAGDPVREEAALQNALAAVGFPAPRVPLVDDEAPFMIAERMPGRPLWRWLPWVALLAAVAALEGSLGLALGLLALYQGAIAWLLVRLHGVSGRAVLAGVEAAGVDPARFGIAATLAELETQIRAAGLDGLEAPLAWLQERRPAPPARPTVTHGDYWPGNVLASLRGLSLIDWSQARVADPEHDLAWIRIQRTSGAPFALPDPWQARADALLGGLAAASGAITLGLYRLARPIDRERLAWYEVLACVRNLAWLGEGTEDEPARETPAGASTARNPWRNPRSIALLERRVAELTGARASLERTPEGAPGT